MKQQNNYSHDDQPPRFPGSGGARPEAPKKTCPAIAAGGRDNPPSNAVLAANDNTSVPSTTVQRALPFLFRADCLEALASIPDKSVHMVLADLPFGTTNCTWDVRVNLPAFWKEIERVLTSTGAVVMFASQPFTTILAASNLPWLKYSLVWEKTRATGFLQAGQKPLKKHEDILVFSPGTTVHKGRGKRHMTYNPQGLVELDTPHQTKKDARQAGVFTQPADKEINGKKVLGFRKPATHTNYPTSVLRFASESNTVHPTQKPVDLCEYLIRTFSNEGEVVLDPTMGSGTSGVAAKLANRFFIGIERDATFFDIAEERIGGTRSKKAA